MSKIYKVANLNEALLLGIKFKESGKYTLFRGHSQNWAVSSTLGRLSEGAFKNAQKRLEQFYSYFHSHKPFEKYLENVDWFYAVAQHYGVPTNYIDFTSSIEVAMYFATNSKINKLSEVCCIVCLQEDDFKHIIQYLSDYCQRNNILVPYIVKPNVDNLWRLQAQQGCFLYNPFPELEKYYPFDRIIFPFTEPYTGKILTQIYPENKSELEILLDQYFNVEERRERNLKFNKYLEKNKIRNYVLEEPDISNFLKKNTIHDSWQSVFYKTWMFKLDSPWSEEVSLNPINLNLNYSDYSLDQINHIAEKINETFKLQSINRHTSLKFNFTTNLNLSSKLIKVINTSCSRIWEGTRNLPFTDNEIYLIIAKYIYIEIFEDKFDLSPALKSEEIISLDLANEYGSFTKCFASKSKIASAFRDDLNEILIDELLINVDSRILLWVNRPNLIFDFYRLLELFKDEIIPYQAWYNSTEKNPVIFYTPTQIRVLGYS